MSEVVMSQQPPYGQQPPPGYGYPPPGYAPPPPPAPQKSPVGKIIGFSCLGIVGLFVILVIAGLAIGGGSEKPAPKAPVAAAPPAKNEAAPAPSAKALEGKTAAVTVTAKSTEFKPTIMGEGDYTSVSVTVTNNSSKPISVNPLYFAITDATGAKHAPALMADEDQIATVELAPGENVTGSVTGKGQWTAKSVTYTDGLIGSSIRADVS